MQPVQQRAEVHWSGDLARGSGTVSLATSGVMTNQPVTWNARIGAQPGPTTPEELIAGAHASCYAMALTATLKKAGFQPKSLDVTAVVTFECRREGWTITSSTLDVQGAIPGLDETVFARLAADADQGCPVSRALRGNVEIHLKTSLSAEDLAASAGP